MSQTTGNNTKEECSILTEMGKYIVVNTNYGITGDILIEINDKTLTGLILPEIVYNDKKKLACVLYIKS